MSDEEKKAIERTQEHLTEMLKKYEMYNDQLDVQSHYRNGDIKIILNLIEKQQKEIDHWKAGMKIVERDKNNHIERLEKELNNLKEIEKSHKEENGKLRVELEQEKEKNKELEKHYKHEQEYMYKRSVLQSLLEKE